MKNKLYVTGRFSFELPNEFPGSGDAIGLPNNPVQWVEDLKGSIGSENGAISLTTEMVADGSETVMLTFAPCNTPDEREIEEDFFVALSRDAAIKLGKALIALAELNSR